MNTQSSLLLLLISFMFSFHSYAAAPINDMKTTIILIQGEPHLVDLSAGGEILVSYGVVPEYFSSSLNHNDLVDASMKKYKDEVENDYARIKFISFESYAAVLNETAINHIREMAVRAENDPSSQILVTIGHSSNHQDDNRANKVVELFEDFGIDQSRISIKEKRYLGTVPNHFIKIEIHPSL